MSQAARARRAIQNVRPLQQVCGPLSGFAAKAVSRDTDLVARIDYSPSMSRPAWYPLRNLEGDVWHLPSPARVRCEIFGARQPGNDRESTPPPQTIRGIFVRAPWGKTDGEGCDFHHLAHHCADVAAVFEATISYSIIRPRVAAGRAVGSNCLPTGD
jgi:hypothetical protein